VESYQDGNPAFSNERAGSHESSADNFIEANGGDFFAYFNIKYLLPIGDGEATPPHDFQLTRGMLNPGSEAGGRDWNPFESGRTIFELRPFFRRQNFKDDETGLGQPKETLGVKVSLKYDNTDWYNNPTKGTVQRVTWAHDWGAIGQSPSWTAIQARHSQYWSLGATESAAQRVIAFDLWMSHSPSWDNTEMIKGQPVYQRPPLFEGSTLGGLERQRGYGSFRFWDSSALNYALEYRYMPHWNPLPDIPYINKLFIPWWQWVAFAELGRVDDKFDLEELHHDMNWTVGGGVRLLVYELVIRADFGVSEEGAEAQMFFGHPF